MHARAERTFAASARVHPFRSAWPFFALSLAALLLEATPGLPWLAGVATASFFFLAGGLRGARSYAELRRLRRTADRLILSGSRVGYTGLLAWRAAELATSDERSRVARSLRRLVHDLDHQTLPGASPVNRAAARRNLDELRRLLALVESGSHPFCARGILLLDRFLTSSASPLYEQNRDCDFAAELQRIEHELLEPEPPV